MSQLELFLYLLPIIVVSLVLHELAHAVVAARLGDPTPREDGRLTLNPISHLDPLGTVMLGVTYFVAPIMFGWAKPVLVQPEYFRRPRQYMAIVAAAGPATNFALAFACGAVLIHRGDPFVVDLIDTVLARAFELNVVLGLFNLLPIPPLDGSRIVGAFMNEYTYSRWSALDQFGMVVVVGLIVLFNEQFSRLFISAINTSADVVRTLAGG